tara:strand:+ start:200 stop:493 length:294 start_codon:yes stop_codon:yes gene_type:complete
MSEIDYIEYEHPDLSLEYEDIVYTIKYEGKDYYVCGYRDGESTDWSWSAQYSEKEESEQLEMVEDVELSNKILIRFFEILEEAAHKGKKIDTLPITE